MDCTPRDGSQLGDDFSSRALANATIGMRSTSLISTSRGASQPRLAVQVTDSGRPGTFSRARVIGATPFRRQYGVQTVENIPVSIQLLGRSYIHGKFFVFRCRGWIIRRRLTGNHRHRNTVEAGEIFSSSSKMPKALAKNSGDATANERQPLVEKSMSLTTRTAYALGHVFNDLVAAMWFSYTLIFLQRVALFRPITAGSLLLLGMYPSSPHKSPAYKL
ncbi:unnamed protein product [Trichogramma brassicae]|uniref:Uncharacterized protein n=1 Tax=Trichogramma brassicae TaxID=86971 RepID=A0A6H5IIG3_9HYME|nr:unnamed protein product [Trichogramma brassicae]